MSSFRYISLQQNCNKIRLCLIIFRLNDKKKNSFYETGIHIFAQAVVAQLSLPRQMLVIIDATVHPPLNISLQQRALINLMNVISTNAGADTGARYNFARSMWHTVYTEKQQKQKQLKCDKLSFGCHLVVVYGTYMGFKTQQQPLYLTPNLIVFAYVFTHNSYNMARCRCSSRS